MKTIHSERHLELLGASQSQIIRSHLEEILCGRAFVGSPRAQEFLLLVVNHALEGEFDQLHERMIGAEMFGRSVSYDTGSDPVVRVKASEVRKKLAQFYSEAGRNFAVKVELPSGSYVPKFTFVDLASPSPSPGVPAPLLAAAGALAEKPKNAITEHGHTSAWKLNRRFAMVGLAGLLVLLVGVILSHRVWRRAATPDAQIHSIAILPFENVSGMQDQEYFADGMTDELITDLGQATTLRVISRTSAMSLKGSKKLLPEIARELDVDAVVEGTVEREGNQVRITAKLIDARRDRLLWANTYNRALTSVLVLQNELAQNIADQVQARATADAQGKPTARNQINVEAEDLYLKGIQQLNADRCADAVPLFQGALNLDPNLARPHAAMATCYGRLGESGKMAYADAFSRQKIEAARAIELDDTLAEGHAELANAAMNLSWDWSSAAKEFDRGLELNPSSAVAHERYAIYLERVGRMDQAIAEAEKGLVLDPVSERSFREAAFTYYFARYYDKALELYRRARANGTVTEDDDFFLGDIYAEEGQFAKSIEVFSAKTNDNPHTLGHLGNAYARAGQAAKARAVIAQLEGHVKKDGLGRYEIALVYAGLGEKKQAFEWLEDSFQAHNEGLTNLLIDPCLDPLRSDARFKDLERRVGLPPN